MKKSKDPLSDHGNHDDNTEDLMSGFKSLCLEVILENDPQGLIEIVIPDYKTCQSEHLIQHL